MNPGSVVLDGALWLAIPIAVLAGLLSFLSPCVLPLVPGYLGFISGAVAPASARSSASQIRTSSPDSDAAGSTIRIREQSPNPVTPAAASRGRLLLGVGLFIAGFTVVFLVLIVFGATLGRAFIAYQDAITRILGIVVIAMGLVFIGVFGFAQRTFRPQLRQGLGLAGAPLLGIAMGIGWAPCIGPTLTAILSIAISQADPWRAGVLAIAYSLGLGIPFLLLAIGFGWASRTVGFLKRHIRAVNIVGGVLLIVLGLLMVTGLWTELMSRLAGVVGSVQLPL
ncbi:cytochrome c biogenesis CcdA family protein [Microbacterium sp. bgisy189]|uniref:cytochrome c biogenesis CcdA family protein n=1 Tax=Microbacterium sp. bgisy189 TaxID=3413798 RepID=UPI003EBA1532